jgi:hypothetical protein
VYNAVLPAGIFGVAMLIVGRRNERTVATQSPYGFYRQITLAVLVGYSSERFFIHVNCPPNFGPLALFWCETRPMCRTSATRLTNAKL